MELLTSSQVAMLPSHLLQMAQLQYQQPEVVVEVELTSSLIQQVLVFFTQQQVQSLFPFGEAGIDAATDKGTDVRFYVSGSTSSTPSAVALFGGNLVASVNFAS